MAQENLTGVRVVRAFGREKYECDRFEKQNETYTALWEHLARVMSRFWSSADILSGLQVMLVVVFGAFFCTRGMMLPGEYIAFISYNSMLVWPVRMLGRMISEMSKAGVSTERIRQIMTAPVEEDNPDSVCPDMHADIAFEHVDFAYEGHPQMLKDVSFTVEKGTTLGILGGTGSSKSTLVQLIPRLYDTTEGTLRQNNCRPGRYTQHQNRISPQKHRHGLAGTVSVLPHACGEYRHNPQRYFDGRDSRSGVRGVS